MSKVISENTFIYNSLFADQVIRNDPMSNVFKYEEKVIAAYIRYADTFSKKVKYSLGIRAEKKDTQGDLKAFDVALNEPPVVLEYLS